jgi:hypothetical protein
MLGVRFKRLALGQGPRGFGLVTGCPRSGTTALTDWLDQQPGVVAVSESRTLIAAHRFLETVDRFSSLHKHRTDYVRETRALVERFHARRWDGEPGLLIEKEPLEPTAFPDERYASFLENVRSLFPDCRLLLAMRNPVNTVWSMRSREWGHSLTSGEMRTYALQDCIRIWRDNALLVLDRRAEPNTYVCRFEALVTEPETESRRVADFLGFTVAESFVPQRTKQAAFTESEVRMIFDATRWERGLLGY